MERVLDKSIFRTEISDFALDYDNVKNHTWYDNLDYLISLSKSYFNGDDFIMDYSCGTGIFPERLIAQTSDYPKILMVDSSPKYLSLAYNKFADNDKFYFRLMNFLRTEKRLQRLEEIFEDNYQNFLNGIVCTNAIHLYPNIYETIDSWNKMLLKGGKLLINSGNIYNPMMNSQSKLIDQTVEEINNVSSEIVRGESRYNKYYEYIENMDYKNKHDELRKKYFLPVRDINEYVEALRRNNFKIIEIKAIDLDVKVSEWYDFLKVYHEGVLGWVGGAEKITGIKPTNEQITDRLDLIKESLQIIFNGDNNFKACWNYIVCEKS